MTSIPQESKMANYLIHEGSSQQWRCIALVWKRRDVDIDPERFFEETTHSSEYDGHRIITSPEAVRSRARLTFSDIDLRLLCQQSTEPAESGFVEVMSSHKALLLQGLASEYREGPDRGLWKKKLESAAGNYSTFWSWLNAWLRVHHAQDSEFYMSDYELALVVSHRFESH